MSHNQIKIFSSTCLSKSMAISCSETTLVSTKQGLAVMFVKFRYLSKKNATKVHKISFLHLYFVFLILLVIKFQENQLIILNYIIKSSIIKGCLPQILLGPFLNTLSHVTQDKVGRG